MESRKSDAAGSGREVQEGGDIRIPILIHVDVWQKPTQIINQLFSK